jgi:multidrug efflux pump subunit AcrA (membrane-fusion protein)
MLFLCTPNVEPASEQIPHRVIPVVVQHGDTATVPIGGSVAAYRSVVLSAQLPGRVVDIAGEEGDGFEQNAILLRLNNDELLAQRRAAQAQQSSAYAALQNASAQYSRMLASPAASTQTPGGFGMPGMFDQMFTYPFESMVGTRRPGVERGADIFASGTQIKQSEQALEQATAQIHQIDTKLRDSQSRAPFDGVIVRKYVEVGDTVQPGQPLLEFDDMARLQVVTDIPIHLAQDLSEGDRVRARIDANDVIADVNIANIFPRADPLRHTVRVKFDLPQNLRLASGTYAEVLIPRATATEEIRLAVPLTAVAFRGGLPVVFTVNEDGRVKMRLVRLGESLPDGVVIVHYGLTENDRVVDRPASYLTSGDVLAESGS